jgi:hypothetical protein
MLDKLPKSTVVGITVILILVALVVIFRNVAGGGENSAYGSKEQIMRQEAASKGQQDKSNPTGPQGPGDGQNQGGMSASSHPDYPGNSTNNH